MWHGDETLEALASASVLVPPKLPDAFANRTEVPARFLLIMSSPGHLAVEAL